MKLVCHSCRKSFEALGKPGRQDTCPLCLADVHCCKQCFFYDANSYNECREPQADRVVDKIKANFCDYFTPNETLAAGETASPAEAAKRKLEELFKK